MSETLVAEVRSGVGTGAARRLRRSGRIPAVLYGVDTEPVPLSVEKSSLERLLGTEAATKLVNLQVGSVSHTVLVKEVQRDPLRGGILHVDFHKVRLDREVHATVPIVLEGGVDRTKDGGIITLIVDELEVSCLPTKIPEHIVISAADLSIGDTVTVAQLTLPEGVTALEDPETVIVSVVAPLREEEAAAAQAEGTAAGATGTTA